MIKEIIIDSPRAGKRLDLFLANEFPNYSRSYFADLIKKGNVLVDGLKSKSSHITTEGERVCVEFVKLQESQLFPEKIKLQIIYEDKNVIVLNKQPGLVVHPAAGNKEGTLVNALLHYFPEIKEAVYQKGNAVSEQRPGLVHRLDKDTSGAIIVAKNSRAMHSLSRQIQNRTIKKIYWALCCGWPKNNEGKLINYLGRHPKNRKMIADIGKDRGKEAKSDYKVLQHLEDMKGNKISLIEFDIKTGRTHQIRVQANIIGIPVLGDSVYGNKHCVNLSKKLNIERQMLHAKTLAITLPGNNKQSIFEAPLPEDFSLVLKKLKIILDN
ncbi:MAG: RluA family pseudouridine synthase [Actinobacteria bacterium]|nr:RluA family pseudouridine synthase [Actinomycetota bacterium]